MNNKNNLDLFGFFPTSLTPSGWGYRDFAKQWCSKPRRKKGK